MNKDLFMDSVQETILNPDWLKINEEQVKSIFPETWTHAANLNPLQIGFQLKLFGIDWRSADNLIRVMAYFQEIGLVLTDGPTIRRNPHTIFKVH